MKWSIRMRVGVRIRVRVGIRVRVRRLRGMFGLEWWLVLGLGG